VRILAVLVALAIGFAVAGSVRANDDVREVQEKLRDDGFYSGEIDGAYSSDLSAALTRYQIRNGLPITGQLDADTSKALGAKPAVTNSAAGPKQSSETWRRLRRGDHKTSADERNTSSPEADETGSSTEVQPRSAPAVKARTSLETMEPASAAPATARSSSETTQAASSPPTTERTSSETTQVTSVPPAAISDASPSAAGISTDRLRDYVAAFVLAGLDRNVGAETEFFADRVQYYDQGIMDRENIREDLKRYDERWPERHFWVAGAIDVEPQSDNRVRVTFPLGFKLRNANKTLNGKVEKTLVLEPAGDDFQIVAVNEQKSR
jgi:peptidoglycan hydrolase-like protein with peptidoglycan-binding domain